MDSLLRIALSNAACAALLALLAAAVSRLFPRRPALGHALWVLVLFKLLTPPVWTLDLPTFHTPAPIAIAASPSPSVAVSDHSGSTPVPDTVRARRRLNISPSLAVATIWAAGSLFCGVIIVARLRRFGRIQRYASPAPPETQRQAHDAASQMGLQKCPPVFFLPGPVCPMLFVAFGHARILLPSALWDRLSPAQQSRLLTHELAHLRRGDHWVRLLELLVTVAYWWNPFLWWSRRELHIAEEACCDAWVAWAFPTDSDEYATALIETIDFASGPPLPVLASGIGHFRTLKRRLIMIQQGRSMRTMGNLGWALIATIVLVVPFSLKMTQAQQASPPPAPPTRGIIPSPAKPPATQRTQQELNQQAQAKLNRPLPALQFDGVGFADVIDFLRDVTGSNIRADWVALGVAGVDQNTPVSVHLRNVTFAKGLDVILASAGDGRAKLTYTIQAGSIVISAADVTNVMMATYDVQAILTGQPDYGPKIVAQIVDTIDPSSWQEHGGNKGMIKLEDGKLFVAQTPSNQRAVSALLARLRDEKK
ncbi:MAG TPA: M56 family metallopeptidase [Tepidisphaeraceae bacterium]|jgi:beta-lactamase regulating signal transducer with metallopeptidase domain|nr:M56 family metallopeptidase [Tepidisphaeraceae bacterium]